MGPDKTYEAEMIDRERCRLDLLSKGLRTGKPYGEFQGAREGKAADKAEFEKEFQGQNAPIAKDTIGKYLESELTAQIYK